MTNQISNSWSRTIKRAIAFTIASIMAFSVTGCDTSKGSDIVLQNHNYSYEAKNPQMNVDYSIYDKEYLTKLNEEYQLDKLVSDCKSDLDKIQTVTKWVTNLWQHDGMNTPEKGDPLFILDEVTKNGRRFRCVEYGTVIYGSLLALGIPARTIGLKMEDVETIELGAGHVATEAYLKDLNKWVFIDGQWGTIPMLNDVPLNCVEFSQALKEVPDGKELKIVTLSDNVNQYSSTDAYKDNYFEWIEPYLYYFDVGYMKDGKKISVMLTPTVAKQPTIFQIKYPLSIDVYTDSVVDFYPIPKS